jgi:predicted RNA-binding Zn-ribbon protein involved in translation (DUF1610 family)
MNAIVCPNCGQPGLRDVTHACVRGVPAFYPAMPMPAPTPPMQVGWRCPVCGLGNAPWIPYCAHCRDKAARGGVSPSGKEQP